MSGGVGGRAGCRYYMVSRYRVGSGDSGVKILCHLKVTTSGDDEVKKGFSNSAVVLWAWHWRVLAFLLPLFSPSEKCPENKPPCSFKEIDHCGRKKRCSGKMKCCKFNCAKKCVDPDEGNTQTP